jgi:phage shock protein PspC (stress-responsive transcriptional regulator)
MNFNQAGGKVVSLFEQRGLKILANNNLMSWAISFTYFFIGICIGIAGYFTAEQLRDQIIEIVDDDDFESSFSAVDLSLLRYILVFSGVLIGSGVGALYIRMLGGLADSSIVCFVESPSTLKTNHSVEFKALAAAWKSLFPTYSPDY